MTAHEKAIAALNRRIERLQANLREAKMETAQQFLLQSIVVTLGLGEALNSYIRQVGAFAQRRHAELKQANDALGAQHAELLKAGQALLEQLKANPADRSIRREIEAAQRNMTAIQKTLRRGANALQRDVAPGLALIDQLAETIRRLCEADDAAALRRLLRTVIKQVQDLYATQPGLPSADVIDADAWESAAEAEIEHASGFHDAYARTGYHALRAIELVDMAVSENPPSSAAEAAQRANDAVAARVKAITARFTTV